VPAKGAATAASNESRDLKRTPRTDLVAVNLYDQLNGDPLEHRY
jgi:hypothetical protein